MSQRSCACYLTAVTSSLAAMESFSMSHNLPVAWNAGYKIVLPQPLLLITRNLNMNDLLSSAVIDVLYADTDPSISADLDDLFQPFFDFDSASSESASHVQKISKWPTTMACLWSSHLPMPFRLDLPLP